MKREEGRVRRRRYIRADGTAHRKAGLAGADSGAAGVAVISLTASLQIASRVKT